MMKTSLMFVAAQTDAELVGETLAGNREAFGGIVSRYQSLVCSLAFSATGSLGQSEDLAQETFITAWKRLGHLRERDKLRAWLCGIARNRINNFLRREGHEPNHRAASIEEIPESHAQEPLPVEYAITKEKEAILWRSLERMPEIYREPLILFYRNNQSIESVAASLDLSEDAVKQRLARGRKLLQEQVLTFVEGALGRTNPGRLFTVAVMTALPASLATSAKAAVLGAGAAKGGTVAKAAVVGSLVSLLSGPFLLLFGNYAHYRICMSEAGSDEERRQIKRVFQKNLLIFSAIFSVFAIGLVWFCHDRHDYSILPLGLTVGFILVYVVIFFGFATIFALHWGESLFHNLPENESQKFARPAFEYRSRATFLGMPLVHICIGGRFGGMRKPVKGWFAMGQRPIGGIFAIGAVAIAPVSVGGVAFGVMPFGAISLGLVSIGAFACGVWSVGALALGWQACGGFALAFDAAEGGFALAQNFALGFVAHAFQANNDAAKQAIGSIPFFRWAEFYGRNVIWFNLFWTIPITLVWKLGTRKNRIQPESSDLLR